MRGYGKFGKWLKKALKSVNRFLKKSKIISRVGSNLMENVPIQYRPIAMGALGMAKQAGYGRRRRRRPYRGSGVRLAGGALRLAGASYY